MIYNKQCTILFDDAIDLTLPYFKIDEETNNPKLGGIALFSNKIYTGTYLSTNEAVILTIMKGERLKYARQSFMFEHEGKKYPLVFDVTHTNRWNVSDGADKLKLSANYKLEISINELAIPRVAKDEMIKKIEQFLNKQFEDDMKKVFEKMQEAKSDALGIRVDCASFILKYGKKQIGMTHMKN